MTDFYVAFAFAFAFLHHADLQEFFEGKGYLNKETGNFQNDVNDFLKRGGHERFNYIGDDPRENDHYRTSDASYYGGEAIMKFYTGKRSYLCVCVSFCIFKRYTSY
jgi:hypothetical protein